MIKIGFRSNKGKKRENNEDACYVLPEQDVYIIADGVGGSNAGEIASRNTVMSIAKMVKEYSITEIEGEEELKSCFAKMINRANAEILELSGKHADNKGMATTLVVCCVKDDMAYFANVGDSRAYIWRRGEIFQLTEDHTYVNSLKKLGILTEEEAETHKNKNMITKAIGAEATVEPDFYRTHLEDEDIIVMCTDGLYGEVDDISMSKIIAGEDNMTALAERLVDAANDAGGRDNITVVCIKTENREADRA